ncbi:hypothetical protein [Micromonospora palomenae]|uniref:hypothetical protein n=1 Tax=Micromonospora palomenae TaxID=1461247 RepID=UPI003F8C34A6
MQAQVPVLYAEDADAARRRYEVFGHTGARTGGDGESRWSYLQCGELTLLLAAVTPRLVTSGFRLGANRDHQNLIVKFFRAQWESRPGCHRGEEIKGAVRRAAHVGRETAESCEPSDHLQPGCCGIGRILTIRQRHRFPRSGHEGLRQQQLGASGLPGARAGGRRQAGGDLGHPSEHPRRLGEACRQYPRPGCGGPGTIRLSRAGLAEQRPRRIA